MPTAVQRNVGSMSVIAYIPRNEYEHFGPI
jgi:hypothetical protein